MSMAEETCVLNVNRDSSLMDGQKGGKQTSVEMVLVFSNDGLLILLN